MRTIVFIGNCQLGALEGLYRKQIGRPAGEDVRYVPSYEDLRPADREILSRADVVVEQVNDFPNRATIEGAPANVHRIGVPLASGSFLWPFAGMPHPRNVKTSAFPSGPYPAEYADTILNRAITKEVDPATAVEQYINLDFSKRTNLDRLKEIALDKQRLRDGRTGFAIADLIEAHFRDEPLFMTPHHPNVRVFSALVRGTLGRLGVADDRIDRIVSAQRVSPHTPTELPIHPAVVEHFGLRYGGPGYRYAFMAEGSFTFEEFALRYMRYTWNEALFEGIRLSESGDSRVPGLLEAGLALSPHSAIGRAKLAAVYLRQGHKRLALASARTAAACNPTEPVAQIELGRVLRACGHGAEAKEAFRTAIALRPGLHVPPLELSQILMRENRLDEARAEIERVVALDPDNPHVHGRLGLILTRQGELAQAETTLRTALRFGPNYHGLFRALFEVFALQSRYGEAMDLIRDWIAIEPEKAAAYGRAADLLAEHGYLEDAETRLAEGRAIDASDPSLEKAEARIHAARTKQQPVAAVA